MLHGRASLCAPTHGTHIDDSWQWNPPFCHGPLVIINTKPDLHTVWVRGCTQQHNTGGHCQGPHRRSSTLLDQAAQAIKLGSVLSLWAVTTIMLMQSEHRRNSHSWPQHSVPGTETQCATNWVSCRCRHVTTMPPISCCRQSLMQLPPTCKPSPAMLC
jgi:hypothetical protein